MLLSLLISPFSLFADQDAEIERAKKEANIITYKVTIYHDKSFDKDRWQAAVDDAGRAIKEGNNRNEDDSADNIVNAFVRGIERVYHRGEPEMDGIHGEMSITVSDGACDASRCGKNCPCLEKYNACPCSADDMRSCEKACKEACEKNVECKEECEAGQPSKSVCKEECSEEGAA